MSTQQKKELLYKYAGADDHEGCLQCVEWAPTQVGEGQGTLKSRFALSVLGRCQNGYLLPREPVLAGGCNLRRLRLVLFAMTGCSHLARNPKRRLLAGCELESSPRTHGARHKRRETQP